MFELTDTDGSEDIFFLFYSVSRESPDFIDTLH